MRSVTLANHSWKDKDTCDSSSNWLQAKRKKKALIKTALETRDSSRPRCSSHNGKTKLFEPETWWVPISSFSACVYEKSIFGIPIPQFDCLSWDNRKRSLEGKPQQQYFCCDRSDLILGWFPGFNFLENVWDSWGFKNWHAESNMCCPLNTGTSNVGPEHPLILGYSAPQWRKKSSGEKNQGLYTMKQRSYETLTWNNC